MKKPLRLQRETLLVLAHHAARVAKWTPVVLLVIGAAGCTDTLGCRQN